MRPREYHLELVGRSLGEQQEDKKRMVVSFLCTNREEFRLIRPKAIRELPEDRLIRLFAYRPRTEEGLLGERIIIHWEDNDEA